MSLFPVFNSKSITHIVTHFRKSLFEIRKCSISIWYHIYDRKDNFIRFPETKKLIIDLCATTNICFYLSWWICSILLEEIWVELFDRMKYRESREWKIPSSEDNIFSPGKESPDRLKSLSSHDNRMTFCRCFKMFEILWDIPRDFSLISDNAILCHSGNGDVLYIHSLIIRMAEGIQNLKWKK